MLYFSQIVERQVERHSIPDEMLPAFKARIRHLARAGIRPRLRPVGRRANFSETDYRDIFYCMEVCALGIPPEKAVKIVRANLAELERVADAGGACIIRPDSDFGGKWAGSAIALHLPKLAR